MELFSEIHSRYFYIISETLKAAATRQLTLTDIADLAAGLGFAETPLTLVPPLVNATQDGYCLLQEAASGYRPVLNNPPPPLVTDLQKRWLKAMINDPRFLLFASKQEHSHYDTLLAGVEPLYDNGHFVVVDRAGDGDDFASEAYQSLFRRLLEALQQQKVVSITYESGKGQRLTAYFVPYKLEYSLKDDKFRLCAVRLRQQRLHSLYKLNLARITSLQVTEYSVPVGLAAYIKDSRMPLPVKIEITNERNGFERIFTQLSNFERISEYDEATKKCHMKIFYYQVDEMELLITLLSFGPVIRVVAPSPFRQQFIERLAKQRQLLQNTV